MEFLPLISEKFLRDTIKLDCYLIPANRKIKVARTFPQLILDTGASTTSITREFLIRNGYGKYTKSETKKLTAVGPVEFYHCIINGIEIANSFKYGEMQIDVIDGWDQRAVVGVIGMDILSQLTFILSHEYNKFLLTDKPIKELSTLFMTSNLFL